MNEQHTQGPENPPDSPVGDDRTSDVERLRDLAAEAGKTWPGQNWPDAPTLHRDGTGVWFVDGRHGTAALNRYIAALSPDVLTGLLDRLESAERALRHIRGLASGEGGDEASKYDPDNALATIVIVCDEAISQPHSAEGGRDE